ncbi:MAG TPA: Rrf2 family transcriptional regulator [Pyrinomonadaceae bacterium]|nr:Rrf2 family transcriptional regulator [Pyrinomonadaceae bacterium]
MPANSRFAIAVHILTLMARAGDEPLKSDEVACSVNTNPVVIRRILCALSKAGLVVSQTGASGGSRLALKPSRITLLEVYRAVDAGDVFALHPQPPNAKCPVGMNIEGALDRILNEVEQGVERVLEKITIEKVLRSIESGAGRKDAKAPGARSENRSVGKKEREL